MTWRTEVIGDCILHNADCMEVLETLGKVDAVVTDPPYGIVNKFGVQNKKDGVRTLQFAWDGPHVNALVCEALTAATSSANAFFCFCGTSQVSHLEAALIDRFTVKPAAWVKDCPPPALPGNWWPSGFEVALYGYRSGAYFGDKQTNRSNVFYSDTYRSGVRSEEKVEHPTQKWLPLMERLVRSIVAPDALCLDPFMGSGTTGVACAKLGRRFIGIEIEPKYFDIACRRIEQAYKQPDFFVPAPTKIKQESML